MESSKMKKVGTILSILLVLSLSLHAQPAEVRQNAITLNWGMGRIMRQDFIFSPILHQQWSPINLMLGYRKSGNLEHLLYARFSRYTPSVTAPFAFYIDTIEEISQSGTHRFNLLDVNYSLGKPVFTGSSIRLAIGGRLRNRLHQSYYCYGPDWLWHMGYYFSFGLDAWINAKYFIGKTSHMEMNLALPLFSYVARSPYMAQDDDYFENIYSHKAIPTLLSHIADGELQSLGRSKSLDFDFTYYYALSERWEFGMSYWLSMNFNNSPVDLKSMENVYFLNTKYNF